MLKNVGIQVRRVFFMNGSNGTTDFSQGVVRSVTAIWKYDIMYDDHNEVEMGEAEFQIYEIKVKDRVVAKLANVPGAESQVWKDVNNCNCTNGHCYPPWSKDTSGFNPKEGGGSCTSDFGGQGSTQ